MKRESLDEALNICIKNISASNIDSVDKVELLLNLKYFLEVESYQRNIQVLQKEYQRERSKKRFK